MTVDDSSFQRSMKSIKLTALDLMKIGKNGSAVVINSQKEDVPRLTSATGNSIQSHVAKVTPEQFVDEIGPETEYAPVIEYGRADMPNYPIQPYVRPSAVGSAAKDTIRAVGTAFGKLVEKRWRT